MEHYIYKCEKCGFIHLVPAYWMNFAPEAATEFPHMNLETGEMCDEMQLALSAEEE